MGVFGGLGGGGGPAGAAFAGLAFAGAIPAYFPASGNAGGALNRGRGGVGSWGGVGSRCTVSALLPDFRGGGGGGGAPRRDPDDEILSDAGREAGAVGGSGGGARACPFIPLTGGGGGGGAGAEAVVPPPFSFKNSTIKSWFSIMKSSVRPCSDRRLPKLSRHLGS